MTQQERLEDLEQRVKTVEDAIFKGFQQQNDLLEQQLRTEKLAKTILTKLETRELGTIWTYLKRLLWPFRK